MFILGQVVKCYFQPLVDARDKYKNACENGQEISEGSY